MDYKRIADKYIPQDSFEPGAGVAGQSIDRGREDVSLYLNVEIDAGTSQTDAAQELLFFAQRVGITVQAKFNGVRMIARPSDDREAVLAEYEREVSLSGYPYSESTD